MAERDITDGEALQIIRLTDDESRPVEIVEKNLEVIMMHPDVRKNPVVVISVAGAYRTGKSFLLGFFLKYLQTKDSDWLKRDDTIRGFEWRYGPDRVTSGIHIWSKPYLRKDSSGKNVAVLLMDTQGTFQARSTVKENTAIFVLSILISSVQIFNVQRTIQEDQLAHLLFFAKYGNLAHSMNSAISNEFQRLIFLVRDWQWPANHAYGRDGGKKYIEDMLQINISTSEESLDLRKMLSLCFNLIEGFLLPEPGEQVRVNETFDGSISDIGEQFRYHIKDFVEFVLPLKILDKKRMCNHDVSGKELMTYIQAFVEMFQGDQLPEPPTVLNAIETIAENKAFNDAVWLYKKEMDEIFTADDDGNINVVERDVFIERHSTCLQQAKDLYNSRVSLMASDKDRSGELQQKILDIFKLLAKLVDMLLKGRQDGTGVKLLIAGVLGLAVGVGVGVGLTGGIAASPVVNELLSEITAERIVTSITAFTTALLNRR